MRRSDIPDDAKLWIACTLSMASWFDMSSLRCVVSPDKPHSQAAQPFLVQLVTFEAPLTGILYATRNDARYPRFVTVQYPLHPFYGRGSLSVRQRCGVGDVEQVYVDSEQTRQAIPLWMTDEEGCARMTIGFDPCCSLKALLELRSLLRSTEL
jgi:hypothetical protein